MKKIVCATFAFVASLVFGITGGGCGPAGPNTPGECSKQGGDWVCGEDGPAGITRCWCDMADPDPHDDPDPKPAYEPQPQPWHATAPTLPVKIEAMR